MTTRPSSTLDRASFGPPPQIELEVTDLGAQRLDEEPRAPISGPPTDPRPSLRKRLAVLLAVVGVPAMAAPGDFGAMAADAPGAATDADARYAAQNAMPFEQPGESFPGSAFYYLADPPSAERAATLVALPDSDPLARGSGEGGRKLGALIDAGPAARPFLAGTGAHRMRAQDCLAKAIWYEAASESEAGQRAVAQVVLNRVGHSFWPGSVCAVVFEGSERRTGCQFSFTCDGSLARRAGGAQWQRAQRIAGEALSGAVYAPIGHATHYHTLWVSPYWAQSLDHIGTIGAHRFYRNRGSAGQRSAFTQSYAGYEPWAEPRAAVPLAEGPTDNPPRLAPEPVLDAPTPDAMATDLATTPMEASTTAPPTPETALADPALGGAGQLREEFARAGQWKVDPAKLNLEEPSPLIER
ncbi:MAG: cell wall hydrolase [Pseudomonadota bacterium]